MNFLSRHIKSITLLAVLVVAGLFGLKQLMPTQALVGSMSASPSIVEAGGIVTLQQDGINRIGGWQPIIEQYVIYVGYDTRKVQLIDVSCTWPAGCYRTTLNSSSIPSTSMPVHKAGFAICINLPITGSTGGSPFKARFKALERIGYDRSSNLNNLHWYNAADGKAPGTCSQNPSASGIQITGGYNSCYADLYLTCDDGTGPGAASGSFIGFSGANSGSTGGGNTGSGNADDGAGSGSGASSTKGTSPNNSAGGGGSAASQQSDKENTTSAKTKQGTAKKQPSTEPSPFFDGILFPAGSDEDTLRETETVTVAGRKINKTWIYISLAVLGVAVAGGGVALFWLWRKKRLHKA